MKDDVEVQPSSGSLFLKVYPSVALPMFLAVVDQTIVATALPAIAASLGAVERVSWVVVAYLVAGTVAAPVYGQLRDVYGGKRMMFVALAVFLGASILCAISTSVEMLAGARVLQGLGGGGLMTLSQSLIGETIPPRERARYQGYLAAVMVTSSTFGPVAGGYLTHHFGWRSVFLVNLPLAVIAFLLTMRLTARATRVQSWRFDTLGLMLFVGFIVPVLLALTSVQGMTAAAFSGFLVLLGIGLASLVGLLAREKRADYPLLPMKLLSQPAIWRSDALAACHGAALVSLVTFLPIYLRVVRGASPSETGLLLLPLMFGIGTGSMITGRIVSRTGMTTIFPSVGLMVATLLLLVFSFGAGMFGPPELGLFLFGAGLFMGTVMGVVQITVQNIAGHAALGSAAASVQLSRSIGASVGTALVGSILFATLALGAPGTSEIFGQLLQQGPSALASLPAPRHAAVQSERAAAFRYTFLAITAFAALGAALAWSIPARRL
ncbi:MAG TPA: MFS transporter [Hyphomicrobiaceae bacterium]|nr:MFS transporter [Hyphomicrobiaceae bacterium]